MKKKLLAIALVGAMAMSMAACGQKQEAAPAPAPEKEEAAEEAEEETADASYTVGICQLVQHPALDAATEGFMDAINAELGDGVVTFDNQNAQGDSAVCATICNGFVSANVDLIMANATPALQAAVAATPDIPVLGTSVTDYASGLDLSDFNGTVGGNVSGTSDLAPLEDQAKLFQELLPDVNTIGLLYCSAEANSKFQVDTIEAYLTDMGYECKMYSFTDSNDIATIVRNAVSEMDALYIPTDNTAASNTEIIASIVEEAQIAVIAGEEGICNGCGIATLSISYYDLGYQTGLMAAEILQGGDVSTMPIAYAPQVTKMYVPSRCEALGITVPDDYTAIEE